MKTIYFIYSVMFKHFAVMQISERVEKEKPHWKRNMEISERVEKPYWRREWYDKIRIYYWIVKQIR